MSSPTSLSPHPVVDALALLEAAADRLDAGELWQLRGQELADSVDRFESVLRRFEFNRLRLLAEFDVQDVAGVAGLSTEAFLRARLRLSPAEAHSRVRSARELVGSVSVSGELVEPELPATAAAAAEGALSAEHVRVVSQALKQLPPAVAAKDRLAAEEFLAEQSRELDPVRVRVLARRLHAVLDPDGSLDEDKPARRELVFRRDVGGMDYLRGRLDAEASATVQAALGALAQPEPAQDGIPDTRSGSRRMADALVDLCDRALTGGGLPAVGGEKPQVTVAISLDDLRGNGAGSQHIAVATGRDLPNLPTANGTRRHPGTGTLGTGVPVTAEAARRIACDAAVIPLVLGSAGEPLDVGRATRTIPTGIRRPSSPATSAASTPAAALQPAGAKPITSNTGPTVDPRHSPISSCSATATTGSSTTTAGTSNSTTEFPTSSRRRSSTRSDERGATPCTTNPASPADSARRGERVSARWGG